MTEDEDQNQNRYLPSLLLDALSGTRAKSTPSSRVQKSPIKDKSPSKHALNHDDAPPLISQFSTALNINSDSPSNPNTPRNNLFSTPPKDTDMSLNTPASISSLRTFTVVGGDKLKVLAKLEAIGGILNLKQGENWFVVSFLKNETAIWDLDNLILGGQCVLVKNGDLFDTTNNYSTPNSNSISKSSLLNHSGPLNYSPSSPSSPSSPLYNRNKARPVSSLENSNPPFSKIQEKIVVEDQKSVNESVQNVFASHEHEDQMYRDSGQRFDFGNNGTGCSVARGAKVDDDVYLPQSQILKFYDYIFGQ